MKEKSWIAWGGDTSRGRGGRGKLWVAGVAAALMLSAEAMALVPSTGTGFNGFDLNAYVGANTFYNNGYTGTRTTLANIEAGWVWNGHETSAASLYFSDPTADAEFDLHATEVGHAAAGRGSLTYQRGIAYGATLWSGSVATSWATPNVPGTYAGNFSITNRSFFIPYHQAAVSGVSNTSTGSTTNFGTADIITSSWGASSSNGSPRGGNNTNARYIDSVTALSGKLIVFSAGNTGPSTNSIISPSNGNNAFVVGALTGSTGSPAYNSAASFSGRGSQSFYLPTNASGTTGTNFTNARARVDISAPGDNLTLAAYGGATGGNQYATGSNVFAGGTNYFTAVGGTSFSAPIVAGGAALLVDAGKAVYPGNARATDGRVLKAVLMNSAAKTAGWSNGATNISGVNVTTQAVDNAVGAGRLDLDTAYTQYLLGTGDVAGVSGGLAGAVGWDYGELASTAGSFNDYLIAPVLLHGSTFTATLSWYAKSTSDLTALTTAYGSYFNLDLQLYRAVDGVATTLVAESRSLYNSSEQIYFSIPAGDYYVLRVKNTGELYNFTGDTSVSYGLAWRGAPSSFIPEPGSLGVLLVGGLMLARRTRV